MEIAELTGGMRLVEVNAKLSNWELFRVLQFQRLVLEKGWPS